MMNDELDARQKIELAKILMDNFNQGDWTELFAITGCEDFPQCHHSFFRDVQWNNEGLKQGCIAAVNKILDNPGNLEYIWKFDNLENLIRRRNQDLHDAIRKIIENDKQGVVPQPTIQTPSQLFYAAIEDAENSLTRGEPQNAIDRIHTATHLHLQHLCNVKHISFSNEAITGLIVKLRDNYKAVNGFTNDNPIVKILIGAGTIFDGLNNLRNHHSMTHPGNTLLDKNDALLAINISRALMSFLDKKL
ncbi:TPA: abortive infection family protein [Serratia marcescens]